MKENFPYALRFVLAYEGGYVNHPRDPGGETNKGVTKRVYDAYRAGKHLAPRNVKLITDDELHDIYRRQYWDAVRGDDLPSGVDLAVFDEAVNSGPVRAVKDLQACLGVTADGNLGMVTLAKVRGVKDRQGLIDNLCSRRLGFLRSLTKIWKTFGTGWTRRVHAVNREGKKLS